MENNGDPDQLTSQKSMDLVLHCFQTGYIWVYHEEMLFKGFIMHAQLSRRARGLNLGLRYHLPYFVHPSGECICNIPGPSEPSLLTYLISTKISVQTISFIVCLFDLILYIPSTIFQL